MAQPSEYLYSFQNIVCLVGAVPITGFADGDDAVAVEFQSPRFNTVAGADGTAVASAQVDYRARVTLKILQTSSSNAYLSTLVNAYRAGVFTPTPFILKDVGGNDLYFARNCFVEAQPVINYGKNVATLNWQIITLNMTAFLGGSTPL